MKKQTVNFFIIIFIILCIILGAIFAFYKNNTDDKVLTSKVEGEIKYLEEKMIAMMNQFNHINFSNSVLIEEQIQNSNQNAQDNSDSKSSNSETEDSKQSSSSSDSSQSEKSNNSQVSTKYEVKNNSILLNGDKEVDWDYIKSNMETIYSTWPTVVVDLHELNVKNEDILNFSTVLDQVTLSAKEEDKTATLNNLASLYAFLPNYRSQISDDNQTINIDYTKNCLINSYALVEQDKWDEIKLQITNAISYFSNVMNNIENNKQSQNHINKIYVLLNELSNSVNVKDKELYYIKYRNVMEELVNI